MILSLGLMPIPLLRVLASWVLFSCISLQTISSSPLKCVVSSYCQVYPSYFCNPLPWSSPLALFLQVAYRLFSSWDIWNAFQTLFLNLGSLCLIQHLSCSSSSTHCLICTLHSASLPFIYLKDCQTSFPMLSVPCNTIKQYKVAKIQSMQ